MVVVRNSRCRLVERPTTDKTPGNEIPTVTAYKRALRRSRRWPWRQVGLKPYWGKPAVRNFRGGRGNEVDGLMTVCHNARKGCHTGSHWPNHVRASALLDVQRLQVKNPKSKFENSLMLTQLTTVKDRCGIALPAASGEAAVTRPPSPRVLVGRPCPLICLFENRRVYPHERIGCCPPNHCICVIQFDQQTGYCGSCIASKTA